MVAVFRSLLWSPVAPWSFFCRELDVQTSKKTLATLTPVDFRNGNNFHHFFVVPEVTVPYALHLTQKECLGAHRMERRVCYGDLGWDFGTSLRCTFACTAKWQFQRDEVYSGAESRQVEGRPNLFHSRGAQLQKNVNGERVPQELLWWINKISVKGKLGPCDPLYPLHLHLLPPNSHQSGSSIKLELTLNSCSTVPRVEFGSIRAVSIVLTVLLSYHHGWGTTQVLVWQKYICHWTCSSNNWTVQNGPSNPLLRIKTGQFVGHAAGPIWFRGMLLFLTVPFFDADWLRLIMWLFVAPSSGCCCDTHQSHLILVQCGCVCWVLLSVISVNCES